MNATPPPLPTGLGQCIRVKLGGVIEVSVDGRGEVGSHVSERANISIFSSAMNSCKRVGLSMSGVTDEIDRELR